MKRMLVTSCFLAATAIAVIAVGDREKKSASVTPATTPTTRGAWPFDLTILRPSLIRAEAADRDRHRFIVEARYRGEYRDPPFDDWAWTTEAKLTALLKESREASKDDSENTKSRLVVVVYGEPAMTRSGGDGVMPLRDDDGRTLILLCNPTYHFGSARVLYVVDGEICAEQAISLD